MPVPVSSTDDLLPVGYIAGAHGVRGELRLVCDMEVPESLLGTVFLLPPSRGAEPLPRVLTKLRRHHGNLLVTLEGVPDRTAAELLRGHSLLLSRDKLPPLSEDEIYLADLPSVRVIAEENGAAREIGVIESVDEPAGQEIWTIRGPKGEEILFPAVPEFVISIDLEAGEARIAPPPGLLELYKAPAGGA